MQTADVRDAAQSAVNQSKSFLSRQLEERVSQVGQQIETVAQELHTVGDQLRQTGAASGIAAYVDQGADAVERFARYLEDADAERLMSDLENIARRQPWAVAAGALALGFGASRVLKASSARRYYGDDGDRYGRYRYDRYRYPGTPTAGGQGYAT